MERHSLQPKNPASEAPGPLKINKKVWLAGIFALFLVFPTLPLQAATPKVLYQADFTGGLNTRTASIHIADNECQDSQNFYFDAKGLQKRTGSLKRNATAIGGGSADVNGLYEYKKSNGTDYCIAFSSTTGYSSTDRCQSFTAFISTLTAESDVNCALFQDRLYCSNGVQAGFYFDGTNDIDAGDMPACKGLQTYQNRLWCFGVAGNLSRIYYSSINDGTTWDTTLGYVDVNPEDGDVTTGIGPAIFEVLPVYKKYSTWIIQGKSASDYTPVLVNSNIGAKSHRAIANLLIQGKNIQVFDSLGPKGSEPGIYFFNGIVVNYASAKIRDDLKNLPNFTALSLYKQWNTKADFDAGTFNFTSSSIDPGMISPSSWTHTDTAGADWAAGTLVNIDTFTTTGSIILKDDYFGTSVNLGSENCTTLGVAMSDWYGSKDGGAENNTYVVCTKSLSGKWGTWNAIMADSNDSTACNNGKVSVLKNSDSSLVSSFTITATAVVSTITLTSTTSYYIKVEQTDTGCLDYIKSPVFSKRSQIIVIAQTKVTSSYNNDLILDINNSYQPTGTFTSPIFDTALSTTIGGPFSFDDTTLAGSTITYRVAESTSTTGTFTWSTVSTTTSGAYRIPHTKRYWKYDTALSTDYSTQTPSVELVTLNAVSTGTWTSAEAYLSSDYTSWGLLQGVESTAGSCVWTYELRSSTYSGGTSTATWTAQTNNAAITITTGPYVAARVTNSVDTSADTCKVDSLTVNYNQGAEAHSSVASVYKGRYYWFGQAVDGTYNNLGYFLDSNGAWGKLAGINARSVAIIDNNLYTGDALLTTSGFVRRQDIGTTDDGVAITAYWRSKDFLLTSDELKKTILDVYTTYTSQNDTNITISMYGDGTLFDTYTLDMSTAASIGIKKWHPLTSSGGLRANYHSIRYDHTDNNSGGSILGYRLYWLPSGILEL